jgi:hypothetical protein
MQHAIVFVEDIVMLELYALDYCSSMLARYAFLMWREKVRFC